MITIATMIPLKNQAKSLIGDSNLWFQANLPRCSPYTTKFPAIMLAIQRYSWANWGITRITAVFKKSRNNQNSPPSTIVLVAIWLVALVTGIVFVSFGIPSIQVVTIGGISIGFGFGMIIGFAWRAQLQKQAMATNANQDSVKVIVGGNSKWH